MARKHLCPVSTCGRSFKTEQALRVHYSRSSLPGHSKSLRIRRRSSIKTTVLNPPRSPCTMKYCYNCGVRLPESIVVTP